MKNYTLKNGTLTAVISDLGAEILSVKRGDCEYVWQGNPDVWKFHAPYVFPVCGRMFDKKYTYRGKTYEIECHGFIRPSTFKVEYQDATTLILSLSESEETKKVYPFDFRLTMGYFLDGAKLTCRMTMENTGKEMLPITVGGHPAFNVPLDGKGEFTDYYLEFADRCSPDRILESENCLRTGKLEAFPLEDGKILRLRHDLFDDDAIVLQNACDTVTLRSSMTDRFVTVRSEGMPYTCVWHKPKMEAPFVCVEPWRGLPGFEGEIEDIEKRPDMLRLAPAQSESVSMELTFG